MAGWHREEDFIVHTAKGIPHYRYVPQDFTAESLSINVLFGMTCRRTHHACYFGTKNFTCTVTTTANT